MKEVLCLTYRYMKAVWKNQAQMYLEHASVQYLLKYPGTEGCLCGKQVFAEDVFHEGSASRQHGLRNPHRKYCSSRCFQNLKANLHDPYPCVLKSNPSFFRHNQGRLNEALKEAALHSTGNRNQPEQACLQSRLHRLYSRKKARYTKVCLPEYHTNQFLENRSSP